MNFLKIYKKSLLCILVLLLGVTLPWFFHPGYLFITDFVWGPNMHSTWLDPQFLFFSTINLLGALIPTPFIQKVFVLIVLGAALLAGKKLAEQFIPREQAWLAFIAGIFTLFNPFVYDRMLYGQAGIVLSYGLLIYGFASFLKFARQVNGAGDMIGGTWKKYREAVLGSISFAFALQFSLHSIFFIALLSIIIGIQFASERIGLKKALCVIGIAATMILILNCNWLIGIATNSSPVSTFVETGISRTDLAVFATAGNTSTETIKNVLMLSGFWGKDQFRYADLTDIENFWGRSFIILLPLILWGLYVGVRNRQTRTLSVSLCVLFLMSFLLALGIKTAWSQKVTYWLFDNVPYYKGLRDTQKWVGLMVLAYTVFFTLGLREFFTLNFVRKNRTALTLFIAGVITMQAPLLVWGFAGQAVPRQYPETWSGVDQYIVSKEKSEEGIDCTSASSQTLFLPWHLYMNFRFTGGIVANPAPNFFTCPIISGTNMEFGGIYDNSQNPRGKIVDAWIASRGINSTLESLNVKYIVLAKEVDWQSYVWIDKLANAVLVHESVDFKLYELRK